MPALIVGERAVCKRAALGPPPRQTLAERLAEGAFRQGPSAARLARLHLLGWPSVNLLAPSAVSGDWNRQEAEDAAIELRRELAGRVAVYLLCGRRVAAAFGRPHDPFLLPRGDLVVLPHPSGSTHHYNDPKKRREVEAFIERWGLHDCGQTWHLL